jgi:hypothetical protein
VAVASFTIVSSALSLIVPSLDGIKQATRVTKGTGYGA